jgi:rare lipoprotein A (peptidoglycan hydrolase)
MRRGSTTSRRLARVRAGAITLVALIAASSMVCANRQRRRAGSRSRTAAAKTPTSPVVGYASWYGPGFHGRRTASGERFDRNAMTLASRHMPFGTRVRVTNLKNGRVVIGRVNDRGPFVRGRVVDLSQGMARKLGISGVGKVRVEVVRRRPKTPPSPAPDTAEEPRPDNIRPDKPSPADR